MAQRSAWKLFLPVVIGIRGPAIILVMSLLGLLMPHLLLCRVYIVLVDLIPSTGIALLVCPHVHLGIQLSHAGSVPSSSTRKSINDRTFGLLYLLGKYSA